MCHLHDGVCTLEVHDGYDPIHCVYMHLLQTYIYVDGYFHLHVLYALESKSYQIKPNKKAQN